MTYKYKTGDKVSLNGDSYMIAERYYPDSYGSKFTVEAYTVYPPGKKNSYGYHTWTRVENLQNRV